MKRSVTKIAGATLLTLGLAVMPATLPAGATTNSPADNAGQAMGEAANDAGQAADNAVDNTGAAVDNAVDENTDNNFSDGDWGLLGLLGLFGLLGRRKREASTYEDPAVRTTTTNRY